jgi:hypothetical protein
LSLQFTYEEGHDPAEADDGVRERAEVVTSIVTPPAGERGHRRHRAQGEDEKEPDADRVDHDGDEDVVGRVEDEVQTGRQFMP